MMDFVKIPPPRDELLEAVLAHPETQFTWSGAFLLCANPHFPLVQAEFSRIKIVDEPHKPAAREDG